MEQRAKFVHTAAQSKQKQTQTIINYCGCGGLNLYAESVGVYRVRRKKMRSQSRKTPCIRTLKPYTHVYLSLARIIRWKSWQKTNGAKKKCKTTATATNELSLAFIVFNCLAGEFFFHVDMYLGGCAVCTRHLQLIYPLSVLHSIVVSVFKSILIRSLLSYSLSLPLLQLVLLFEW